MAADEARRIEEARKQAVLAKSQQGVTKNSGV
jgi:hypothetical protein